MITMTSEVDWDVIVFTEGREKLLQVLNVRGDSQADFKSVVSVLEGRDMDVNLWKCSG